MDINNAIKRFVEPINYSAPNYVNRSYRVDMDIKTAENMLNHIADLEQRLADAESKLDAGEALLNRMAMNLMLSGYTAESNSNNPIKDWLDLVIKWKKRRVSDD